MKKIKIIGVQILILLIGVKGMTNPAYPNVSNYTTWTVISSEVFLYVTSIHDSFNYGYNQETACLWGSVSSFNSNKVFIWNNGYGDYTDWSCRTTFILRDTTNTATCSGGHIGDWWSKTGMMYFFGMGSVWVSPDFATTDGMPYCIDTLYPLARCGSMLIDGDIIWVTVHTGATDLSLYTTGDGIHYGKAVTFPNFASNQYQMEYGYSLVKQWNTLYISCETSVIAYYSISSGTMGYTYPPDSEAFVTSMQSTPAGIYYIGEYGGENVSNNCSGGDDLFFYDGTTSTYIATLQARCGNTEIYLYGERVLSSSNGKVYSTYELGGCLPGTTYCHSWDGNVLRNEMECSMFGNATGGCLETILNNRGVLVAPHYHPLGYILVKSDAEIITSAPLVNDEGYESFQSEPVTLPKQETNFR